MECFIPLVGAPSRCSRVGFKAFIIWLDESQSRVAVSLLWSALRVFLTKAYDYLFVVV